MSTPLRPRTIDEVVEAVRAHPKVHPVGTGTKPALASPPAGFAALSLTALSGIVEYDPGEFTVTALAGTPLAEVGAALARNGQHLPFDPPFADAGATLGGTIAAGLSGPGRQRYGGVRDFILGVRIVTGAGELVRGGGKVVKNAAGFDLPKLFVGSLGRLGPIVEATFKVFPRPRATATLRVDLPDLASALAIVGRLGSAAFDLEALEVVPGARLYIRLGGAQETFPDRLARLAEFAGSAGSRIEGDDEAALWKALRIRLPASGSDLLAKVPLTLDSIQEFDRRVHAAGASRRYSAGGNLGWLVWPAGFESLDMLLRELGLCGVALAGPAPGPLLGIRRGGEFLRRVKSALDPDGRFAEF